MTAPDVIEPTGPMKPPQERRPEAIELPELRAGTLDLETLEALFSDIERLGHVQEVRLKAAATRHADPARSTLADALEALRTGAAHGAQILYEHDEKAWCDTVLAEDSGWKLLRMESPRRTAGD